MSKLNFKTSFEVPNLKKKKMSELIKFKISKKNCKFFLLLETEMDSKIIRKFGKVNVC